MVVTVTPGAVDAVMSGALTDVTSGVVTAVLADGVEVDVAIVVAVVGVEGRLVDVALVDGGSTVTIVARAVVPAVGNAGNVDVDASSPPLATVNPAATKAPEAATRASGTA